MKAPVCISTYSKAGFAFMVLLACLFTMPLVMSAQVNTYTFTPSTGTYTANTSSTTLINSGIDDQLSSLANIGFSFIYDGVAYTQFRASSNGYLTFNTTATDNSINALDAASGSTSVRPGFAPLWDDLATGNTANASKVDYLLTGTPGSRVLTVEWNAMRWNSGSVQNVISFQAKLYETTNNIEFIYSQGTGAISSGTGSIGIMGSSMTDYISVKTSGTSPAISTTMSVNGISNKPATNQVYRFTPPPTIYVSPALVTVSGYNFGAGPQSMGQSFTVNGFSLISGITVNAPADYEISLSPGSGFTGSITLNQSSGIVANTTIYIRLKSGLAINNYNNENIILSATGAVNKTVSASSTVYQPNNDCDGAVNLTVNNAGSCSAVTNGTTLYTNQSSQASCSGAGTPDDDVWYRFTALQPNETITVTSTTSGGITSPSVEIFNGNCGGTFTSQGCSNSTDGTYPLTGLINGGTYYVRVYSSANNTNQGAFTICASTTPTITVTPTTLTVAGYNETFGPNVTATESFVVSGSNLSGNMTIDAPSNFQISLSNTTGFTNGTLTLVPSSGTVASTTIYVRFKGGLMANNYSQPINLTSAGATAKKITASGEIYQPNNDCNGAISLGVSSTSACANSISGTTVHSTQSLPGCSGSADDDVWYKFKATQSSETVTVDTLGGAGYLFNIVFEVFQGNCGSLTSIRCQDQSGSPLNPDAKEVYTLTGLTIGSTYYVRVYSFGNDEIFTDRGAFNICITAPAILSASTNLISFGNKCANATYVNQFTVIGSALGSNVNISGPTGYTYSTSSTGPFTATLSLPPGTGNAINQPIYVLFSPATATTYNGNIIISTSGSPDVSVALQGTGLDAPGAVAITPSSITDCYGSINSLTASIASSAVTVLSQDFEGSSSLPSGWLQSDGGSVGGTPSNAYWDVKSYASYTYNKYINSIPPPISVDFYNRYTFTDPIKGSGSTQFVISNSNSQTGTVTNTVLTTASFSTVGYASLSLNFYNNFSPVSVNDRAIIEISTDGGVTFSTVQSFNTQQGTISYGGLRYSSAGDKAYVLYTVKLDQLTSVNLSSYVGFSNVVVRFRYIAYNGSWWAIDNVSVTGSNSASNITWSPIAGLYTNGSATLVYNGTTPTNTIYTKLSGTQNYTATATIGTCTAISTPVTVKVSNSANWTGNSGADWNTAPNWCNNSIPVISSDVFIPGTGITNYPVLSAAGTVHNLNIAAGATVDLNNNTLTVNGALSGDGTFTGSDTSGLVITTNGDAGTALFTSGVSPNGYTSNYLKTLTINSGSTLTIGDSLNITSGVVPNAFGTVTVNGILNSNDASTNPNGLLVLRSDANGTAQIGQSNGTVNGEVMVQRYFPALRAWRFVGLPFSSSTQSINQAWQEGYTDVTLTCPPQYTGTAGYGTAITYNNLNGYDVHNNNYKTSLQVYKNNAWTTLPSTLSGKLTDYNAYSLFVRGDRYVCLTTEGAARTTTLRAKGQLNQTGGNVVRMLTGNANDYVLVGNPYAASIDLASIISAANSTGIIADKFLIWDPRLGGSTGVGGYVTYSGGAQVPAMFDLGYTANTIIQSGQAFMVQLAATSATLTFHETDKATYQNINVFGLRAANPAPVPSVVYTNLEDTTGAVMDGVAGAFGNQYSANVDSVDAAKRWNEEIENMAIIRHDTALAIEFRPMPKASDTLFFRLYLRQHPYRLKVFSQNLAPNFSAKAWIVDKYLNTQTEINLSDTSIYNFTPNSDTNSYRNRFMLVFSPVNGGRIAKLDSLITRIKAHIFPNPVSGRVFNLVLESAREGNYTVNIYTINGTLSVTRSFSYKTGTNSYSIIIPGNLMSGNYTVQVLNSSGIIVSVLLLIISK